MAWTPPATDPVIEWQPPESDPVVGEWTPPDPPIEAAPKPAKRDPLTSTGMGGGFLGLPQGKPTDLIDEQSAMADTFVDQLPMLGATVAASAVPGGAFVRGALPFLKFAGQSALSAFAGGAAGGGVRAALNREPVVEGAVRAGAEQGLADLGGSVALKGLSVVGAPAVRALTSEGKQALEFAQSKGLPASPSDIFPTVTNKAAQMGLDKWLPGRLGIGKRAGQIAKAVEIPPAGANQLIVEAAQVHGLNAADDTAEQVATSVTEAIKKIRPPKGSGLASQADEAYDAFYKTLGDGFQTPRTELPHLTSAMNKIEAEQLALEPDLQDTQTLKFIADLRNKIKEGGISGDDLYKRKVRLGKLKGESKNIGELRDAVLAEFEELAKSAGNSGEAMAALKNANLTWAAGKKFANHKVVKEIAAGNLNTANLFRSSNIDLLKDMGKRLPESEWNQLLALNLEDMINRTAIKKETGGMYIDGKKLLGVIDKNREMFESVYPKETLEAFENLAAYASVHRKMVQRSGEEFFAAGPSAISGAAYWGAGMDPSVAVGSLASWGLALDMLNPQSKIFKWLTGTLTDEGLTSFLARSGLRFASDETLPDSAQEAR